jgi:DNA polymerase-3 subunit delta'
MQPLPWHQADFEKLLAARATLPHALLLHGARGIGKLDFARALAQALLCEAPAVGGHACGACGACAWFDAGAHPDYARVEPIEAEEREGEEGEKADKGKKSTVIKIEQIRDLTAFVNVGSQRGGRKVIVIHPCEALNPNAANALLKSLEEPPPQTQFILVSHRPHQLLATIKSRCSQLALRAPDSATAAAWLAERGMREPALALAYTGDAPLLAVELGDSEYWGTRAAFLRHLTARDLDVLSASEAARDFPIPHVVTWLQKWAYDVVYFSVLGTVRYNPDQRDAIARVASAVEPLAAMRFYRDMVKQQRIAQHPLNARLFIEHLLLAYRDLVQPQGLAA